MATVIFVQFLVKKNTHVSASVFLFCAPSRNTTLLDKDIAYTELQALHLLPYTESVTFTEILSIQGRFFEFLFYAAKIQKIQTQTTDIPYFTFRLRAGC